jgi:hypothetical protein
MRDEKRVGLICVLLVVATALPSGGQAAQGTAHSTQIPTATAKSSSSEIVREIADPSTGIRWLLVRDASHPGGPGRMVPVAEFKSEQSESAKIESREGHNLSGDPSKAMATEPVFGPLPSIVRAGDRLIVEEHTSIVDARLEAIALGPAAAGATLNVRLKIGGKVVRALVLGPGRATLQTETEARP